MNFKNIKSGRSINISLKKMVSELNLTPVYLPKYLDNIFINNKEVCRAGLYLTGYFNEFDPKMIEIIGSSEYGYLASLDQQRREKSIDQFFSHRPALVIITKKIISHDIILEKAKKYQVPLLKIEIETGDLIAELISFLNIEMAPTVVIPGEFMEVYGEGILMLGESGIGKSETAIELMKRGHRLVADDVVTIKKISHNTLIGTSPENIRHFLEIRGIGIINAKQIFGLGAVKVKKTIDLLINLEKWNENKIYERIGTDYQYTKILNIKVPTISLPIKVGRSIAVLIETAAMNHRQNKMGYSASEQLLKKLGYKTDFNNHDIDRDLDLTKIF